MRKVARDRCPRSSCPDRCPVRGSVRGGAYVDRCDDPEPEYSTLHSAASDRSVLVREVVAERDDGLLLAEPGQGSRRGKGVSRGLVMETLGDRPAREVTTREIEDLLRSVASTGVAPRTVNKVRQLVCAIFNYGMRPSTYGLASNPAAYADRRREPDRGPLAFYSPEQIEELARSLAAGAHRDPSRPALSPEEIEARACEDF